MGNCQAAEVAAVVIQHPGSGKVERAYRSLTASHVMSSNPGHYVAAVVVTTAPPYATADGDAPVKHLKLLRPDDTLHIGHVYRLVSFEEVLREFASKKHVKLGRLPVKQKAIKHSPTCETGGGGASSANAAAGRGGGEAESETLSATTSQEVEEGEAGEDGELEDAMHGMTAGSARTNISRYRQWRPTLQSIGEDPPT